MVKEIEVIDGQKSIKKNKKVIITFNLRKNQEIDFKVSLKHVTLPHVRDFNGHNPKSSDGRCI